MSQRRAERRAKSVVKTVILIAFGLLFVSPLLWMISSSLKGPLEVFGIPFRWIPDEPRWQNYVEIWTDETIPFLLMYFNSFKIAILSIVGQVVVSSLAAYAFAKMEFKGKNLVFMIFLASMMIPSQVTIIPQFMLFHRMGLYNTHWAVIFPVWFNMTSIFLFRQFYMAIPNDLVESAKIDGASHLYIWSRIILPLTKPPMISVVILAFISAWDSYLQPLIFLVSKELYTVALGVNFYYRAEAQQFNLTMAAATSAIIPILIIFIFGQRYFVEGITRTGIKG